MKDREKSSLEEKYKVGMRRSEKVKGAGMLLLSEGRTTVERKG